LLRQIEGVDRLHRERHADPVLSSRLLRLGQWQARRLRQTYADLAAQQRYAAAIAFFESDLYGGDFTQRDADLARVVPMMARMLPEPVTGVVAQAIELNALSQELDRLLLRQLPARAATFSVAEYCQAYREMGRRDEREQQIRVIAAIGAALDRFVRKPYIRAALATMRQPAKIVGMSALHEFLDRGFDAFRRMNGAAAFLDTIVQRETALTHAIFAGEPAPFPDPMAGGR
jgi:hypothetical protein